MELVEAVMNLVAAKHMIRPCSYQGINILRSLYVVHSARDQKIMLETFVNLVLSRNRTREIRVSCSTFW